MCNCLWECLKCPGKLVCCCCECACKMVLSILCSFIVLLVIIGLIVYFTVYYGKDSSEAADVATTLAPIVKRSIRDYFKKEY
ncbi:uncharacterized protein Dwil_GK10522 [Drosophila willistoni]|uniref:Protein midgut expression 1 n=1 Tax=Drosophila willistoni TaxID=7260 RepID=B4NLW0_DROWI|nr:protein midgut expression 1 [Drosophila willistoni]EDW85412.1 uncharacterized protein Dwil_GK10522 [Drosophila willistoni]